MNTLKLTKKELTTMNTRLMVCSLVAATLILPALAYAQNNQGDGDVLTGHPERNLRLRS